MQKICEENNVLVVFCLDVLELSADLSDVMFLYAHPEDFGTAYLGDPASTFQLPRMQDVVTLDRSSAGLCISVILNPTLGIESSQER